MRGVCEMNKYKKLTKGRNEVNDSQFGQRVKEGVSERVSQQQGLRVVSVAVTLSTESCIFWLWV